MATTGGLDSSGVSGSVATSGDGSGSSGSSGSAESSSTGADECAEFRSSPIVGPEVQIELTHSGSEPVYYEPSGCSGDVPFRTFDVSTAEEFWWSTPMCIHTCDMHLIESYCSPGCIGCAPPEAGWIQAGTSASVTWTGLRLSLLEWTDACTPEPECDWPCAREEQAEPGQYRVELTVFRTCTGECVCEEMPVRSICKHVNADSLSDPVTVSAIIDYPSQTTVELVIPD